MQGVGQTDCEHKYRYLRVLPFVLCTKTIPSLISSRNGYLTNWLDRQWRAAFFWVITQSIVGILYRRFGPTYRPHLEERSDKLIQNIGIYYKPR
jgi:hypothetical protein